jgi:precorrin-6B methylase 2
MKVISKIFSFAATQRKRNDIDIHNTISLIDVVNSLKTIEFPTTILCEPKYVGETKDKLIYDLYSGTGTIAQILAPVAKKVVGVEIIEEAVEAAKENAALNGLTNCEFIAGDVLKVLDDVEEKPDFIILDPPRDGVHPKALKKIIDYGVDRLIYISCKPTSLVRDLEMFLECGYHVDKAVPVEQFPWTANVETICMISKNSPDNGSKATDSTSSDKKEFAYREEEIPSCECIYG